METIIIKSRQQKRAEKRKEEKKIKKTENSIDEKEKTELDKAITFAKSQLPAGASKISTSKIKKFLASEAGKSMLEKAGLDTTALNNIQS